MRKTTLIKLLCLALACAMLLPMVIACGEETPSPASSSGEGETVFVNFKVQGGYFVDEDTEAEIEIEKGTKLKKSQLPDVERDGYEFVCWSYTKGDPDDQWESADKFREDTTLYAVWEKVGGNDDGNDENGGNNTDGSTDSSTPGTGNNDQQSSTVKVEYNTGTGYFENVDDYEKVIEKDGRIQTHPTPVHQKESMRFDGWYKDANCTIEMSPSDKYSEDTVLYAKWTEVPPCTDQTYDHVFSGGWSDGTAATCTKPGTIERYCDECGYKETSTGDPAKGHQFGQYEEAFMSKKRTCGRLGCGEVEVINYVDVTQKVLGNEPASQIDGNADAFFLVPFTALINGTWDEGYGRFVGPNGSADAYVIFNFIEATTLDRIYFKGDGTVNMNIYVQYEGEDDYTYIGMCSGVTEKEATPFKEPDTTKKIVSVKFLEQNPKRGESLWQEVAFVKVAAEE